MGLTDAVEMIGCTCIALMAPVLLPQCVGDLKLWLKPIGSTVHGETWGRASAMTFLFPLKYSMYISY